MPDIDFVVAWVDGSDPDHIIARNRFKKDDKETHEIATHDTRFLEYGEIYYLIASIIKYAHFVRKIYIITDNQRPKFIETFAMSGLCDAGFIEIVSHDVIFRDLDVPRPTFNARVIEAAMWRIPGLSEHFVYANDDMFLNGPVSGADFFEDGKPLLHVEPMGASRRQLKTRLRKLAGHIFGWKDQRPKHLASQELGASLAGMTGGYFHAPHQPHPLRRSTFEKFYGENPDILSKQLQYRFRNVAQYNSVALANTLEMLAGAAIVKPPLDLAFLTPDKPKSPSRFLAKIRHEEVLFGCMQSLDAFSPSLRMEIHGVLGEKFADVLPAPILEFSRNAS